MPRHRTARNVIVLALVAAGIFMVSWPTPAPPVAEPMAAALRETAEAVSAHRITDVPAHGPASDLAREPAARSPGWRLCVVDAVDRAPVQGARIELAAGEASSRWVAREPRVEVGTTGRDGRCEVPWREQPVVVHVTMDGFVPRQVGPCAPAAGAELVLPLTAAVPASVLVRDAATGRPLAGARVHTQPASFLPVVRRQASAAPVRATALDADAVVTGADGLARLHGVAPGFHDLTVVASGMLAADLAAVEIPFAGDPYVVDLVPGHELVVQVVDEQGAAASDWDVQFRLAGRTWVVATDAQGFARSPGLAAGTSVTVLVPRRDLDLAAMFAEALLRPTRAEVQLPHASVLRLVVAGGHAHPLRVVWTAGAADDVLDVQLLQEMTPQGHGLAQKCRVAADAAQAVLGATATGMRARFVVQAVGTRSGIWRSEPFHVTAADQIVGMREVVPRSGIVHGSVCDEAGRPIVGARVSFAATTAALGLLVPHATPAAFVQVQREVATDDTGGFACDRLLPGRYLVEARGDAAIDSEIVDVADTVRLDLELTAVGRVRGRVQHAPFDTVLQVQIAAAPRGFQRIGWVDPEGGFEFGDLAAGRYAVALLHPVDLAPLHAGGGPVTGREVAVDVVAGGEVPCEIDAAEVVRSVRIEVSGAPPATPCTVQVERLFPFDRTGHEVWRWREPLATSGVAVCRGLDPAAGYVVSLRRSSDLAVLAWSELPRRATSLAVRAGPGVSLVVHEAPTEPEVWIVPLAMGNVPVRESGMCGERTGDGVVRFAAVVPGAYRLELRGKGGVVAGSGATMRLNVGSADTAVTWSAGR